MEHTSKSEKRTFEHRLREFWRRLCSGRRRQHAVSISSLTSNPRPLTMLPLGLLSLPLELLFHITDYLDDASKVSLSVTSRRLLRNFGSPQPLEPEPKRQLLFMLERDIPNLYYCFLCSTLHPWSTKEQVEASYPQCITHLAMSGSDLQPLIASAWNQPGINLPFSIPRLIMNRHFYGKEHGLTPDVLNSTKKMRESLLGPGSRCKKTWRARIVQDELLLACETVYWHTKGDAEALRRYVNETDHKACKHQRFHDPEVSTHGLGLGTQLTELRKPGGEAEFTACQGALRACPECATDCCFDLTDRGEDAGGWEVKIWTYHDLGSLRWPEDWRWFGLVDFAPIQKRNTQFGYGAGAIRQKWLSADDVHVEAVGEWAEIPSGFL